MKLYGAINLRSTNDVTVVIDERDRVVYQKRLPNDLALILKELSGCQSKLQGIMGGIDLQRYWLVDGLMEQGHRVQLANTAAIQQYEGSECTDDHSDARWLAHLLRLGMLPEGYIYPEPSGRYAISCASASQLMRQRTTNRSSIRNLSDLEHQQFTDRQPGQRTRCRQVDELLPDRDLGRRSRLIFQ